MILFLFQLLLRIVFACVALTLRLATLIGWLAGLLVGRMIQSLWNAWRNHRAMKVELRAPGTIARQAQEPTAPPSPSVPFIPRPLRPRSRR